jgi:hypothetical protein
MTPLLPPNAGTQATLAGPISLQMSLLVDSIERPVSTASDYDIVLHLPREIFATPHRSDKISRYRDLYIPTL